MCSFKEKKKVDDKDYVVSKLSNFSYNFWYDNIQIDRGDTIYTSHTIKGINHRIKKNH